MEIATNNDLQAVSNSTLGVAMAAVAGVAEIANALRPTLGDSEVERIVGVMLERLGQFQSLPGFQEAVAREIREKAGIR